MSLCCCTQTRPGGLRAPSLSSPSLGSCLFSGNWRVPVATPTLSCRPYLTLSPWPVLCPQLHPAAGSSFSKLEVFWSLRTKPQAERPILASAAAVRPPLLHPLAKASRTFFPVRSSVNVHPSCCSRRRRPALWAACPTSRARSHSEVPRGPPWQSAVRCRSVL